MRNTTPKNSTRKRYASSFIGAAILLAGVTADASTVLIDDVNAMRVRDTNLNGTGDVAEADVIDVGRYSTSNSYAVFVFQMTGVANPSLITAANFSVGITESINSPTDFNVDAHVIRKAESSTILITDYETSAQLLMADFGGNNAVGSRSLDATGQGTFATWLQNNWADGEYVFIGLKSDPATLSGGFRIVRFGSSGGGWTADSTDAQLNLTVIPEPSTALLGGLGVLFLLRRRRA